MDLARSLNPLMALVTGGQASGAEGGEAMDKQQPATQKRKVAAAAPEAAGAAAAAAGETAPIVKKGKGAGNAEEEGPTQKKPRKVCQTQWMWQGMLTFYTWQVDGLEEQAWAVAC